VNAETPKRISFITSVDRRKHEQGNRSGGSAVALMIAGCLNCAACAGDDAAPARPDAGVKLEDASAMQGRDASVSRDGTARVDAGETDAASVDALDTGVAMDALSDAFDAVAASGPDATAWWPTDAAVPTDGATSTTYPAFLPSTPRIVNRGGPVITAPVFVPIVFPGDPYVTEINAFLAAVGPSEYWRQTTSEYGVGPATTVPATVCPDISPDGGPALDECIALTGLMPSDAGVGDAELRDASDAGERSARQPIYIFFLPEAFQGTVFGEPLGCFGGAYGGIHSYETLSDGQMVVVAVVGRCPAPNYPSLSELDFVTSLASHEMVEAATDPYPFVLTGYAGIDDQHLDWWGPNFGASDDDLGDMCEVLRGANPPYIHPAEPALSSFSVQRTWSNAAFAAGHDPCVPQFPGEVYVNAMAVTPDAIDRSVAGFGFYPYVGSMPAVRVPVGGQATVDLALYADGNPGAPWAVTASGSSVGLTVNPPTGQNGDILKLTISVPEGAPAGWQVVTVESGAPAALDAGDYNGWYFDLLIY